MIALRKFFGSAARVNIIPTRMPVKHTRQFTQQQSPLSEPQLSAETTIPTKLQSKVVLDAAHARGTIPAIDSSLRSEILTTSLSTPLKHFVKPVFAATDRTPSLDALKQRAQTTLSSSSRAATSSTRVTVLENGLTVATEDVYGHFSTLGIIVKSGSRYEVAFPSGTSHVLEKLAFGACHDFPGGRDEIYQFLEQIGGICDSQTTRDSTLYAASVDSRCVDQGLHLIHEAVMRPLMTDDEVNAVRLAIRNEFADMEMRPEKDFQLTEMIHAAAYRGNTLGFPKFCPLENLDKIDRKMLMTYKAVHYTPTRMCIAGVGVDHELLVKLARKYFVETPAIWTTNPSLLLNNYKSIEADASVAQYTGGELRIEKDLSDVSLGPTPMPELAHFVVALECTSYSNEDEFITVCVLNMLMGGGGSFSAGGPGKGMYTRLYLDVLNQNHWVHNATASGHIYADTGLFCVYSAAPPEDGRRLVDVVLNELRRAAGPIEDDELDRAKKQLQSMLLMNLESKPVIFEDLARQTMAYGRRRSPEYLMQKIEQVSAEQINVVATKMLKQRPTVAILGDLRNFPKYDYIEEQLAKPLETASGYQLTDKEKRFKFFGLL